MTLEEKWLALRSKFPKVMPEPEVQALRMVFMAGVTAAVVVMVRGTDEERDQFSEDVLKLAFEVQPAHGEERPM